jgi:hypothetical protein
MLVEEDKRAKELASKPKIKGGDDEPDWQNVTNSLQFLASCLTCKS